METVTNKLALVCGRVTPLQTPCLSSRPPGWTHAKASASASTGLCGQGVAVGVGRGGAQKGVTKEVGRVRGARMENPDNPAQPCLRLRVAPAPLCALSLLCSSTRPLTVHRRPEMPPWSSHYIANMQSFLWLKKKVIISRNNVRRLECKQMHFFKCLFFWKVSLELLYIWEGGVGGMNEFITGGSAE